jgi:Ca2+-binding EF-hand superfamily protein
MADKQEDFGDRPQQLIAAFKALDRKNTGKLSVPLLMKLMTNFDDKLTAEERQEFFAEADDKGFVVYQPFVKDVIFGKVK